MKDPGTRLPGELLRRAAERFLPRRIVDGVVIPAIADLQHEHTLAHTAVASRRALVLGRGYVAFWTALALCLVAWPTLLLHEDWLTDDGRGRRLLRALAPRALVLGLAFSLVLVAQLLTHWPRQGWDPQLVLLALPSIVTVAVPIAFLLGLVLALGRLGGDSAPRQWLGPVACLSIASGLFTFLLCGWLTPQANQSYRERALRALTTQGHKTDTPVVARTLADGAVVMLPKGPRELTLGELHTRIRAGRLQRQSTLPLDIEWHKKWAIPAACLVFGPLAIGLQGLRRRPRTAASFVAALAAGLMLYWALRIGEQSALNGRIGPLPAIWAGDALLALTSLWLIAMGPRLGEGGYRPEDLERPLPS